MLKKDPLSDWVIVGEFSEDEASAKCISSGVPLPKGEGRVFFVRCNFSGRVTAVRKNVFNAGRHSHRHCCDSYRRVTSISVKKDPTARSESIDKVAKRLPFAKTVFRRTNAGGDVILRTATSTGFVWADVNEEDDLWLMASPPHSNPTAFRIPVIAVRWLRWWENLHLDPSNPPPSPTGEVSVDQVLDSLRVAENALLGFIATARSVSPEARKAIDARALVSALPTTSRSAHTPKFAPEYLYGYLHQYARCDYGTQPPIALTPVQVAGLITLMMGWSTYLPGKVEGSLRHMVFEELAAAKPERLPSDLVAPWFTDVAGNYDTTPDGHQTTDEDGKPLVDEDGRPLLLYLEERDHIALAHRPPSKMWLPKNYREHPCKWVWENAVRVDMEWPPVYDLLPERP